MQQAVRYEVIYERHVAGLWQPSLSIRPALIVEDERAIRELLALHLTSAGFAVETAADGSTALRLLQERPFELVVLDVMLPGVDGVTMCQRVRSRRPEPRQRAILMVTARDTEADKVRGLESGADDYIAKPFGVRELLARVTAVTRRHAQGRGGGGRRSGADARRAPHRYRQARRAGARRADRD